MSILGKLLIVFNLLAAGAFAYFTLENYSARQRLTTAQLEREIILQGIPVQGPETPPAGLDKDNVPFSFLVSEGSPRMESIEKKKLDKLIPPGDQFFGGEAVADQTAEIKRLQQKVIASIPAPGADPVPRLGALRGYLLNLARTGAERDGVNGLFDLRDPQREYLARRDLPLVARTQSQTAALRALVEITELGDPQAVPAEDIRAARIALAREAIRRFLLGEVPHGVAGAGDKQEAERQLRNALLAVFEGKGNKDDVKAAAPGFEHLAAVAVEPLADQPSIDRAAAALVNYALARGETESEKAALTAVATLIRPPALNFVKDAEIEKASLNLLNSKFDDAAQPATGKPGSTTLGQKARKIAHILYHIDAHRHLDRTPEVVSARKAWHQRVATVVGLPEYIRAAEAQATEYADAAQRLVSVITEEESAFRAQYQEAIQRVTALYTQWLSLDAQYRAQQAITAENERLMAERRTERDNLKQNLDTQIIKAREALEGLQRTQAQLFAIQKQLRDAQAALLTLEGELRRIELGDRREVGDRRKPD